MSETVVIESPPKAIADEDILGHIKAAHPSIGDMFSVLLGDREIGAKVAMLIANPKVLREYKRKPKGWNGNAPYYKKRYGEEMRSVMDAMMADGNARIWEYQDFPQLSAETIYNKINQSIGYVIEQLDPDGKYAEFHEQCSLEKERGVGITYGKTKAFHKDPFIPSVYIPSNLGLYKKRVKDAAELENNPDSWQAQLELWIEHAALNEAWNSAMLEDRFTELTKDEIQFYQEKLKVVSDEAVAKKKFKLFVVVKTGSIVVLKLAWDAEVEDGVGSTEEEGS